MRWRWLLGSWCSRHMCIRKGPKWQRTTKKRSWSCCTWRTRFRTKSLLTYKKMAPSYEPPPTGTVTNKMALKNLIQGITMLKDAKIGTTAELKQQKHCSFWGHRSGNEKVQAKFRPVSTSAMKKSSAGIMWNRCSKNWWHCGMLSAQRLENYTWQDNGWKRT